MEDTRKQTIDWAIKYIISGTGLIWLRDAINACCKEQEEICHVQNNFDIYEVRKYLENEPMIKCVANEKKLDWEQVLNQIIANPELTELSIDWKNEN